MLPRFPLLPCLFVSLLIFGTPIKPTFDAYFFPNTTTFAPNCTCQTKLKNLLSSLSANTNRSDGFYNIIAGEIKPDNTIYGIFLYPGDITTAT